MNVSITTKTAPDPQPSPEATTGKVADGSDGADARTPAIAERDLPQATKLLRLCDDIELFHSPKRDLFGTVPVDSHLATYGLQSDEFNSWLVRRFFKAHKSAPNGQALESAIGTLKAKALIDGLEKQVFLRVGGHDGNVYVDLGDDLSRVVEVSPSGWQVVSKSPVKFRRTPGMLALPVPTSGGSIEELRPFVNVPNENEWNLLKGFLVGAFKPTGPYPVLEIHGQHGSAKSTLSKMIRKLVDPNAAPARGALKNEHDLAIAANNGWLLVFDNLSKLTDAMSDAICRLSTGGAFSTRTLYSDTQETLFDAERPVVLNGIKDLATKADLLDRAVVLSLPPLAKRRDEDALWKGFEEAQPRIIGAILMAVSVALTVFPTMPEQEWPRMADFAKWVTAAESALDMEPGDFMSAYTENREEANRSVLDDSPVAKVVLALAGHSDEWIGTAQDLLRQVRYTFDGEGMLLPNSPRQLSGELRSIVPNLKEVGVSVVFQREGKQGERMIHIFKSGAATVSSVSSVSLREVA